MHREETEGTKGLRRNLWLDVVEPLTTALRGQGWGPLQIQGHPGIQRDPVLKEKRREEEEEEIQIHGRRGSKVMRGWRPAV